MKKQLLEACEGLVRSKEWQDQLAANVYWASCEGFLQSTLLWAFNSFPGTHKVDGDRYLADRERYLVWGERRIAPDLVFFGEGDEKRWWDYRDARDRENLRSLAAGLVEVKMAWLPGSATGSATLGSKAVSIQTDVDNLRYLLEHKVGRSAWVVWCVAGFPGKDHGRAVEESVEFLRSQVKGVRPVKHWSLFAGSGGLWGGADQDSPKGSLVLSEVTGA